MGCERWIRRFLVNPRAPGRRLPQMSLRFLGFRGITVLRGFVYYSWGTTGEKKFHMVNLTETAVSKVKEILDTQEPKPAGLRISVVGGGCSGFSYSMAFENTPNMLDKTYTYGGLKVFIDQASLLYLDGAQVDYIESLEGSGFKFNNPQVKSTCGCGSSFSV
jgi:iron-sulfur cluster assembly accessory protein